MQRIPFLKGILPLASRLSVKGAEKISAALEMAAKDLVPDQNVAEWEGFFDFKRALEERRCKLKAPKGALKKPGSAAKPNGRR